MGTAAQTPVDYEQIAHELADFAALKSEGAVWFDLEEKEVDVIVTMGDEARSMFRSAYRERFGEEYAT